VAAVANLQSRCGATVVTEIIGDFPESFTNRRGRAVELEKPYKRRAQASVVSFEFGKHVGDSSGKLLRRRMLRSERPSKNGLGSY
jgi:hypothetical protein